MAAEVVVEAEVRVVARRVRRPAVRRRIAARHRAGLHDRARRHHAPVPGRARAPVDRVPVPAPGSVRVHAPARDPVRDSDRVRDSDLAPVNDHRKAISTNSSIPASLRPDQVRARQRVPSLVEQRAPSCKTRAPASVRRQAIEPASVRLPVIVRASVRRPAIAPPTARTGPVAVPTGSKIVASGWINGTIVATKCATNSATIIRVTTSGTATPTGHAGVGTVRIGGRRSQPSHRSSPGAGAIR